MIFINLISQAPLIAKKALAGQFVMIRINDPGERIPLTIADSDPDKGFITIISLSVGKSTKLLALMEEGDFMLDVLGP
jgi:ferredoxin/flavodoxin---NADP+ reductase